MKKDTITITRAEYAQLNKAANAAVEHACELFQAARLVDELKARIAELEDDNDALERRIANVQADRDEWRHCHAMLQNENAARKCDEKKAQLEEMYRISCKETDEAVSREEDEAVIAAVEAVELRLKAYWLRNR